MGQGSEPRAAPVGAASPCPWGFEHPRSPLPPPQRAQPSLSAAPCPCSPLPTPPPAGTAATCSQAAAGGGSLRKGAIRNSKEKTRLGEPLRQDLPCWEARRRCSAMLCGEARAGGTAEPRAHRGASPRRSCPHPTNPTSPLPAAPFGCWFKADLPQKLFPQPCLRAPCWHSTRRPGTVGSGSARAQGGSLRLQGCPHGC